jgi:hypothetical protein
MPSYKWIYRAGQYLAGIFAAGVWRGKGMTIVPPIASHFLVLEGPSLKTIILEGPAIDTVILEGPSLETISLEAPEWA